MNREIKFRMWNCVKDNPSASRMIYDIDNVMDCLKQQMTFYRDNRHGYDNIGDGNSFMQFTGIANAENNQKLYEGDIIEFRANYSSKPCGYMIGVIVWDYDSWKIKVGENIYCISEETCMFIYKFKILGNIHQNPELLQP